MNPNAAEGLARWRAEGHKKAPRKKTVHTVKTMDGGTLEVPGLTRALAIKLLCTECLGWEGDPKECTAVHCPVFPFRGRTRLSRGADAGPDEGAEGAEGAEGTEDDDED